MSGQVTLERLNLPRLDGAWHHMTAIEAGKLGLTSTRHGSPDRWDWGRTLDSLVSAQQEWERDDAALNDLLPAQRAMLFASDSPFANRMRRHMAKKERRR